MTKLVLELDTERERRLRNAAAHTHKSEAEVCRDALDSYLRGQPEEDEPLSEEAYEPFMKMIGMVKDGPVDGSIYHDVRPGDPL